MSNLAIKKPFEYTNAKGYWQHGHQVYTHTREHDGLPWHPAETPATPPAARTTSLSVSAQQSERKRDGHTNCPTTETTPVELLAQPIWNPGSADELPAIIKLTRRIGGLALLMKPKSKLRPVRIPIHGWATGQYALVDRIDAAKVRRHRWWMKPSGYVFTRTKDKNIALHRLIHMPGAASFATIRITTRRTAAGPI